MNRMDQVRRRFVLSASGAVFVLLTVLLSIINGINFTMAAADADAVTRRLETRQGVMERPEPPAGAGINPSGAAALSEPVPPPALPASPGTLPPLPASGGAPAAWPRGPRMGPMGPDSPETAASIRYFTYAFDTDGGSERVAFAMSAVSEEEAERWADSLRLRQNTGWTRTTYRYRVYPSGGREFVSVIDQGRELLPSLRILLISVIGGLLCVAASYFALVPVSRRLFRPLEEADRKQERFIASVEKDFQVPLTVLDVEVELLERENGESGPSRSMRRQIRRMASLVKDLSALALFDKTEMAPLELDLSDFARAAVDSHREKYAARGLALTAEVEDHVTLTGDGASLSAVLEELLDNALKFGKTYGTLSVKAEEGRVEILMTNDTDLPSRSVEEVFDRFTRLENAKDTPGAGLGLSLVREIVRGHNGRISAKSANGIFTVRIRL